MKKILAVLAVAGMILLSSSPAGAGALWGTGSPVENNVPASGPSPLIFKFNTATGALIGGTFGYSSLNWMLIRAIADSGQYLYVSHNTYNTDSGSTMDTNDYKIAKLRMDTGAVLSDTSVAAMLGQPNSMINALEFRNGKLYGVENATGPKRGYTVEITLDGNGDVSGAAYKAVMDYEPDGALDYYSGLWYSTAFGYAPDHITPGSLIFTSPDLTTTDFTQVGGTVDNAVTGMGAISGWEFDGAGNLFAVSTTDARAVYSINLGTHVATKLYDLPVLPNITALRGLSDVVPDTTAPVVTVPANMTVQTAGGGVAVTFSASAQDNVDGALTPVCTPASGATFPLGTTTVTCTATDSSSNVGSNSFTVTVVLDFTPPVVTVPADIVYLTSTSRVVTFSTSALDNIDGSLTPICSPASGSTFTSGTTTVTCSATDSRGNIGTNSFKVTLGGPGAPVGVWAIADDARAIVYFTEPLNDGGDPITSYTVTSSPGGITATGSGSPIIVTGLSNDTTYTFTVTAANSRGTGRVSVSTNSVTPTGLVPVEPGIWAMAGDTTATITISAGWPGGPITVGGVTPTITHYTVTISPGGGTQTIPYAGANTQYTWTGLTNGTPYTFTATETNSSGKTSPVSLPSNSVTPTLLLPAPPGGVYATAGDASATVYFITPWNAPQVPAISSYTVTSYPDGITASGAGSPITVTGLTNNPPYPYTFTVTATNANGTSPASLSSNGVTPTATTPPVAPGIWVATGNASATLHISAPYPGAPTLTISSYTATISPGGTTQVIPYAGADTPYTWSGLTNGETYSFTVTATNSTGGVSPASLPSNPVTPVALVPAAPGGVWATAGDASATVNFSAPWNLTSVPAITGYTVTSYPDGITASRAGTSTAPITVTGLTNNTPYTFTVTASNFWGASPASQPSNTVTPIRLAPPVAPGIWVTAGDASATLNISAPYSGGPSLTISSYTATINPGGTTQVIPYAGANTTYTWTGLTNGTPYTFTVYATNSAGTISPESTPSNSVTPSTLVPVVPEVRATAGDTTATITITDGYAGGPSLTISSYTATISPGGTTQVIPYAGASTEYTWTGLTNGTPYTFTVTATNSAGGTSAVSLPSNSVTPTPLIPAAPQIGAAIAGDASATVNFAPPWNASAIPPITSYTVTSSPGGFTATGVASPITVSGLMNDTPYTFTVTATNSRGTGPASVMSNEVWPRMDW